MIDASIVLEKLKLMMPLAQHTEPAAQLLCEQAAQALTAKLADPVFAEDARITFAAAALAGSWLVKCRAADEMQQLSFRAGDVSITPPKTQTHKSAFPNRFWGKRWHRPRLCCATTILPSGRSGFREELI